MTTLPDSRKSGASFVFQFCISFLETRDLEADLMESLWFLDPVASCEEVPWTWPWLPDQLGTKDTIFDSRGGFEGQEFLKKT